MTMVRCSQLTMVRWFPRPPFIVEGCESHRHHTTHSHLCSVTRVWGDRERGRGRHRVASGRERSQLAASVSDCRQPTATTPHTQPMTQWAHRAELPTLTCIQHASRPPSGGTLPVLVVALVARVLSAPLVRVRVQVWHGTHRLSVARLAGRGRRGGGGVLLSAGQGGGARRQSRSRRTLFG
jgi:hypothetical protein